MVLFLPPHFIYKKLVLLCDYQDLSEYKILGSDQEKALYVYGISRDVPFDIDQVITEDILERTKRPSNTALRFPSLITELCMLSNVQIAGNEEKTPHPYPLFVKGMAGYDSRRDELDEEDAEAVIAEERLDKQDEWHRKMYETLATATSRLA